MKKRRRKQKFDKQMQKKLLGVFAFVLLVLVILNLKIAYINIKSGDKYAKQVLSQKEYDSRTIPYRRGEIQDRNGNVLARSEKVYTVILDCKAVNEKEAYLEPTVQALASSFGLDAVKLRSLITAEDTKNSQYQVLKKKVTQEEKDAYEASISTSDENLTKEEINQRNNVKGIWFEESYVREYPMKSLASTVVGFSNDLSDGIVGLESYYTDVLNGVNGREFGYLNEDSELQRTVIEPENGYSLVSTLDVNIQQIVEKYIKQLDEELSDGSNQELNGHGAKNIAVIVMNPKTGEIYAMATNHGYDLSDPYNVSSWYDQDEVDALSEEEQAVVYNDMWSNFCVSYAFELGSTFKPITVSAALETGSINPDDTFYCDGYEFITDTRINCDNINGHGMETVREAIQNSCNDALMQIGYRLGVEKFCKYQRLFNFGSRTGIDLPNENIGSLYTTENMHEVELATNTFGQGFTSTMIQEIAAFSAVVNGGYYYQPHMVKQIINDQGGVVKTNDPILLRQPISESTSKVLQEALEMGVLYGTGKKAWVPGYRIGGKTGTAEKINPETGQRWSGRYIVSFIGAAPIDNPEVVVYSVVDEPNVEDQTQGGYPHIMSRKILMEILPYLNIPATEEYTDEELAEHGITREEAEAGRITETETPETDENGNVIQSADSQVADNPNISNPPAEKTDEEQQEGLPDNAGITREDLAAE